MRTRTNSNSSSPERKCKQELLPVEKHNAIPFAQLRAEFFPAEKLSWPDPEHHLTLHTAKSMSKEEFDACFELCSLLKEMYKRSSLGWKVTWKKREMRHPAMRYLLLENSQDQLIGFTSFMITEEEGMDVIYCYELQLDPGYRRRGYGERLLAIVEDFGRAVGFLEKAMLTVFVENEGAIRFYSRLGYTIDEISPAPKRLRSGELKEPTYNILSKELLPERNASPGPEGSSTA